MFGDLGSSRTNNGLNPLADYQMASDEAIVVVDSP
jgi:hypothetical protein